MIHLLIVNYHSADLIAQFVRSISGAIAPHIVIVNNSPDDEKICRDVTDYVSKGYQVSLLKPKKNLGFGAGCNVGLQWIYQQDPTAVVWILNPDTELLTGALEQADRFFQKYPKLSIVGTLVRDRDNTIWFGGGYFRRSLGKIEVRQTLSEIEDRDEDWEICDWISGCSMLLNFKQFSECPQFDPAFFLYYEDFDFCQRYRQQGHTIAFTPTICIVHHPSSITNRNLQQKYSHSTRSYLLALRRYASLSAYGLRWGRLLMHGFLLLAIAPEVGLGKLKGLWSHCRSGKDWTHR